MIKFILIILLLIFYTFFNEIIKVFVKIYRKKYYINKEKSFTIMCEIDNICKKHRKKYYINKEKSFTIMCEIDNICKKHRIKYYFSEGTALGLYRDGDLIKWDDDIDIAMEEKEYNQFVKKCLPEFISKGYYFLNQMNSSLNHNFLTLLKNGHLIDIENVKKGIKCTSKSGKLCDELLPYIKNLTGKQWRGRMFPVPEESYYVYLYGKNWRVPRKTKDQKNV